MNIVKLQKSTLSPALLDQLISLEERCGLEPYTKEMLEDCIAYMDTYAAMEGEQILGFITLQPYTRYAGGGLYITNLNVAPEYRRQGLGRKLIFNACCRYLDSHRGKNVVLDVAKTNTAAIGLYRRLGFQETDIPSRNGNTDMVMEQSLRALLGVLSTPRLTLRPMLDRDLPQMSEIMRNTTVNRTYMLPDLDEEGARKLFTRMKGTSQDGIRYFKVVCLDEKCIGWINEVELNDNCMELGWVINPAFHNQGYATEAARAVIGHLFSKGLRKVIAGAFEENPASMRVMEKAGMAKQTHTDEIEYRGKVHTCIYYAIENKD